MSRKVITENRWSNSSSYKRRMTFDFYYNKYFNLFMNAYKFNGITEEQQDYILRKFWSVGSVAAFIVAGTRLPKDQAPTSVNEYPNGMIAFVPFAPFAWDITDWPIKVNLVRTRGAKFIPAGVQVVNKDCVVGYCQRNKKSILSIVEFYVNKIVDIEMTIGVQLTSHKAPWLIATTPENEEKFKKLFERITNDEEVLYISATDADLIKALVGGNSYIVDKLFQQKCALENELLTILGIDNVGTIEKKEHLVVDEVNSNNEVINSNSDNFLKPMQEFCERISKFLGFPISVETTQKKVEEVEEEEEEETQDEEQ